MSYYQNDPDRGDLQIVPMSRAFNESALTTMRRLAGNANPQATQGLCPSCLNSGYVHAYRTFRRGEHETQVLGVVYDTVEKRMKLCACKIGQDKAEQMASESSYA
jgi:hypothetical protein